MTTEADALADIIFRIATPADADGLLQYVNNIVKENNPFIPLSLDEIPSLPQDYSKIIKAQLDMGLSITLIAISNDKIIGRLDIEGYKRRAYRHVVTLAISIERQHRGIGLGSALFKNAWIG